MEPGIKKSLNAIELLIYLLYMTDEGPEAGIRQWTSYGGPFSYKQTEIAVGFKKPIGEFLQQQHHGGVRRAGMGRDGC